MGRLCNDAAIEHESRRRTTWITALRAWSDLGSPSIPPAFSPVANHIDLYGFARIRDTSEREALAKEGSEAKWRWKTERKKELTKEQH